MSKTARKAKAMCDTCSFVYDKNVNFTFNDRKEFNLTTVNTGMYLLQISSNGKTQQHRIVIE